MIGAALDPRASPTEGSPPHSAHMRYEEGRTGSCRCRTERPETRPCLPPLEDMDRANRPRSAKVLGETDLSVPYLIDRLATTLPDDLIDLGNAGGAHRMSFGEQPPAWVDRNRTIQRSQSLLHRAAPLSLLDESKILSGRDFGDAEAIVHLRHVDITRGDAGRPIRLPRGHDRGLEGRQVRLLKQGPGAHGVARPDHVDRPVGESSRDLTRAKDRGRRAVADWRAVIQPEGITDQARFQDLVQGHRLLKVGLRIGASVPPVLH